MTQTAHVLVNTLTNYARFALMLLVMFVLTPRIISAVGHEGFGLWSLTFSVLGLFGLLDLGIGTTVVKYVAECKGRNDTTRRNQLLSTLLIVNGCLALVAAGGIAGLSFYFTHVFAIPQAFHATALPLLWILAARLVVVELPFGLFRGILFGEQKIYLINFTQMGATGLYGGLAWFALEHGVSLITLAWLNLVTMFAEYVAYCILAFICVPGLRVSWRLADRALLKEVASFSASQLLVNSSNLILLRTDPMIVKLFLPLPFVAVYAIALKIAENAHLLTKQFVNVLAPLVAQLKGQGQEEQIRILLVDCAKFALAPAVMLAVVLYTSGQDLIVFWVGPEFISAGSLLHVLMSAMVIAIPKHLATTVFTMTGYHVFTARATMLGTAANIILSLAMARPYGLLGIALGTLISSIGIDIFVVLRKACTVYSVSYRTYWLRAIAPAVLPGILQFFCTLGVKTWCQPADMVAVGFCALPGCLIYGIVFWWWSVSPSEKQHMAHAIRRRPSDQQATAEPPVAAYASIDTLAPSIQQTRETT